MKRFRYACIAIALVGGASSMMPAAVVSNGTITVTSPVREQASGGEMAVNWTWRSGKLVKSTSKVDVAVTLNGISWYTIGRGLPIRSGAHEWDTSTWPDGLYAVRAHVYGTSIKSVVSPLFIDNTAPTVRVARPAEGEVLVEDERTVFFAAVIGTARLEADAHDSLSGISKITWILDEEVIGEGSPYEYNFSTKPGRHTLTAEAVDRAGNKAHHSITIVVAPGPSVSEGAVPEPPPVPDPNQPPDPSTLPLPVPSDVPTPGLEQPEVPPVDNPIPEGLPTP